MQAVPEPDPTNAVSRHGDIWRIGRHRLICGDATILQTYATLLGRERADMIFGDPPYNCRIDGHASGLGRVRHREFVQASGEMSSQEFQHFLYSFMHHCARYNRPGALHYFCMDWRNLALLIRAGEMVYDELINLCVWAKTNAGMGSLYRSAHELVAIWR